MPNQNFSPILRLFQILAQFLIFVNLLMVVLYQKRGDACRYEQNRQNYGSPENKFFYAAPGMIKSGLSAKDRRKAAPSRLHKNRPG